MDQLYKINEHYKVSGENYEIRASIVNGKIILKGSFHKPGDSSCYSVRYFESFGLPTENIAELIDFVMNLPVEIRMPMNAMIVHICTVYNFLNSKQKGLQSF